MNDVYVVSVEFFNHRLKRTDTRRFTGDNEISVELAAQKWKERSVHCEIINEKAEWVSKDALYTLDQ